MKSQHHRFRIWNTNQHPLGHSPYELGFSSDVLPNITNVGATLDWILAVIYPNSLPPVADIAARDALTPVINDYVVVLDDGDGKPASYRFEQREGDPVSKWYKIYDMDWGEEAILSNFLNITQDVYVYKAGMDDLDSNGDAYTGDLSGQRVYGGATANTNLILYANSGDGTGSNTGDIFAGDDLRPITDNAFIIGDGSKRWKDSNFALSTIANIAISASSIVSAGGSIAFGANNLSTTGSYSAGSLLLGAGSITDSSGGISFGNDNLTTTGNIACDTANTTSVVSTNITQTGQAGIVKAILGVYSASLLVNADVDADAAIEFSKLEALTADRAVLTDGTGVVSTSAVTATELGYVSGVTSAIQTQIDAKANRFLSNLDTATAINLSLLPTSDGLLDLGATTKRWNSLFIDSGVSDGTLDITTDTLMGLRDTTGSTDGQTLFWDNTAQKWNPSLPDDEISHNTINDLTNQDDHTQYALLAGRLGSQTIIGGTGVGEVLTLKGSSNASSGGIVIDDVLGTTFGSSNNIGTFVSPWNNLVMKGEFYGGRVENVLAASLPSASGASIGRMYWVSDSKDLLVDTGSSLQRLSQENIVIDMVWNGSETSKVENTSASIEDATMAVWAVYDAQDGYKEIQGAELSKTSTQVTVSVQVALPAGTYRLIGIR